MFQVSTDLMISDTIQLHDYYNQTKTNNGRLNCFRVKYRIRKLLSVFLALKIALFSILMPNIIYSIAQTCDRLETYIIDFNEFENTPPFIKPSSHLNRSIWIQWKSNQMYWEFELSTPLLNWSDNSIYYFHELWGQQILESPSKKKKKIELDKHHQGKRRRIKMYDIISKWIECLLTLSDPSKYAVLTNKFFA